MATFAGRNSSDVERPEEAGAGSCGAIIRNHATGIQQRQRLLLARVERHGNFPV